MADNDDDDDDDDNDNDDDEEEEEEEEDCDDEEEEEEMEEKYGKTVIVSWFLTVARANHAASPPSGPYFRPLDLVMGKTQERKHTNYLPSLL